MEPKRQIDGVFSSRPKPVSTGKVPLAHSSEPVNRRRTLSKRLTVISLSALVMAGLIIGLYKMVGGSTSLVPKDIQNSVDFSVYYPDVKELPPGYSLDTTSFHLAQPGVVIYSVVSPGNQRLVFSEEQTPDQSIIDKFTNSSIPLHTEVKTSLGQAEFGAYGTGKNLRSVASLPIKEGPWLIVTAPSSSSHEDLVHIIQTLTK